MSKKQAAAGGPFDFKKQDNFYAKNDQNGSFEKELEAQMDVKEHQQIQFSDALEDSFKQQHDAGVECNNNNNENPCEQTQHPQPLVNDSINDRDEHHMSFLKEFELYDSKKLYDDHLLHSPTAILGSTAATNLPHRLNGGV